MQPKKPKAKPIKHGTLTAYSYDKCRCAPCRAAWAAYYKKKNSKARRAQGDLLKNYKGNHGSSYSYKIGCRCEICVGYMRQLHYTKTYNLSAEEHEKLFAECEGKCSLCRKPAKLLKVDHDHITGNIRGLLCNSCNAGLGMLGDNEEGLLKALEYVKRNTPNLV